MSNIIAAVASVFSTLEGALFMLAFVAYGTAIARPAEVRSYRWFFNLVAPRKMEAHIIPFFIWLAADVLVLAGMIKEGTVNAQILAAVTGGGFIVVLGWFHRKSGWDWTDKLSLFLSVTGLVLWQTLDNSRLAIVFGLAAIFFAGLPIYKEAWQHPDRQNKLAWILWASSCAVMLTKVTDWTLESAGQPIVFAVVDFMVIFLIFVMPFLRRLAR